MTERRMIEPWFICPVTTMYEPWYDRDCTTVHHGLPWYDHGKPWDLTTAWLPWLNHFTTVDSVFETPIGGLLVNLDKSPEVDKWRSKSGSRINNPLFTYTPYLVFGPESCNKLESGFVFFRLLRMHMCPQLCPCTAWYMVTYWLVTYSLAM